MSKKSKVIGQLDLFDANGEALFHVEEVQIVQITQETNTKLQTNLNQDPDFMYIPAEIDPDFYPEELFLGNEDLPDTIPEQQDIPELTAADIPPEEEKNDIELLIELLNQAERNMEGAMTNTEEEVTSEIKDGPLGTKRHEEITKQEINGNTPKETVGEDSLWLLRGFLVDLGVDDRLTIKQGDTVILIDTEKNNRIKVEDIIDQEYDDRHLVIGEFLNYSPDTRDTNIFIDQVYTSENQSKSDDALERIQNIPVEHEENVPVERDSDFYPEEWFLGNEDLPDEIPEPQEGPKLTIADIPEENKQDYSIDQKTEREYQDIMERYGDNRLIAGIDREKEHTDRDLGKKNNNNEEEIEESIEFPENIPLIIENNGRIDHVYTRKAFSIYETVDFYLNILDEKEGFVDYEFCIPKFKEYLNRLGTYEIDELRKFRKETKKKADQNNEVLYNIDGSLDFIGMSRFYGIDRPIKELESMIWNAHSDEEILRSIETEHMDTFLASVNRQEEIVKMLKNKDNITYLFDAIQMYFEGFYIEGFSKKGKRDSYKILFSILLASISEKEKQGRGKQSRDENVREEEREKIIKKELAEFSQRCRDKYGYLDERVVDAFWNIINKGNTTILKEALQINHLSPMFGSYTYKNQKEKNLGQVFKKHTIKDFLFYNIGRGFTPGRERNQRQEEIKEKQRRMRMNAGVLHEDSNPKNQNEAVEKLEQLLKERDLYHYHFKITEDQKEISHDDLMSKGLSLEELFKYHPSDWEDIIRDWRRKADKDDLPF